jgi:hypothetical protein
MWHALQIGDPSPSQGKKAPRYVCQAHHVLPCQGLSARLRHLASGAQIALDPWQEGFDSWVCPVLHGWGKRFQLGRGSASLTGFTGCPPVGPSPMLFIQNCGSRPSRMHAALRLCIIISFALRCLCFSLDSLYPSAECHMPWTVVWRVDCPILILFVYHAMFGLSVEGLQILSSRT